MNASLLVELFVEELPPKALKKLGEAVRIHTACATDGARPGVRQGARHRFRIAAPAGGADRGGGCARTGKGRFAQADAGVGGARRGRATPPQRLLKKLAVLGADASAVAGLRRQMDGKAEALFLDSTQPGATLADGLQKALDEAIARLPIPKVMSYQLGAGSSQPGWTSVSFVRPAHGLVAMHGSDVLLSVQALGLTAGNATHGHRFEATVDPVVLRDADSYADQLRGEGAVIASFDERRAEIVRQLDAAAERIGGGVRPIEDEALLDEVTALVERPNVLVCEFEPEFLGVPQECLILTMKANQKLLSLAGRGRQADPPLSGGRQHHARRPQRGCRRQRARGAAAPGRCQILFRPGPQEDARFAGGSARQGGLSQQAGHAGRAGGARACDRARHRAGDWATQVWFSRPTKPRASPRPTWSPTWSANFPSCRESWAATTRSTTVLHRQSPLPSKTTTSRAFPVTACRAAKWGWWWRWPTSWRHWWACLASATSRQVIRGPICFETSRTRNHPDSDRKAVGP